MNKTKEYLRELTKADETYSMVVDPKITKIDLTLLSAT
jgi:hypothetical protein